MLYTSIQRQEVLLSIKGGLIVSCQARVGWPMYGKEIMAAFAKAAEIGGAVGIRANGPENISEIIKAVNLPIIGINKIWRESCAVYITPTFQSAVEIIEAGSNIIAIDGTNRLRPENETLAGLIRQVQERYPQVLIMADVSTLAEGIAVSNLGVDLISTTLSGYTEYTASIKGPDFDLIRHLAQETNLPIIAEGKIHTPEEAALALEYGAHAVVVGTAITRPEIITGWFTENIRKLGEKRP